MRFWTYLLISISYIMAGLLAYTASKKILDYESYIAHVRDVELMSPALAVWAARAAIAVEYGLALVLLLPLNRIQIWGWKVVVLLMLAYNYYIFHVQHYAPFTPCSCKGVTEKLSWTEHSLLNTGLGLLALLILGIYYRKWIRQKIKFNNTQNSIK
jgi:4-hydroxybenzoate polyprenyltransferase